MRHIDEISNGAVKDVLRDADQRVYAVHHHRYEPGQQCDWAIEMDTGDIWAWFGGDESEEVEALEDLGIFDTIQVDEIEMD